MKTKKQWITVRDLLQLYHNIRSVPSSIGNQMLFLEKEDIEGRDRSRLVQAYLLPYGS